MNLDLAPLPFVDFNNRENFIHYLLFYHAIMTASGPLLKAATARLPKGVVRAYYIHHYEEEYRHAKWLAEDLASADVVIPRVNWRAASLAGTQYYLINHVSPIALLGYMIALESRPMPLKGVAALERCYGEALCRTLRFHAAHDVDHSADLFRIVGQLTANNLKLVTDNAVHTAQVLSEGF
jgi:hypothetical protein